MRPRPDPRTSRSSCSPCSPSCLKIYNARFTNKIHRIFSGSKARYSFLFFGGGGVRKVGTVLHSRLFSFGCPLTGNQTVVCGRF